MTMTKSMKTPEFFFAPFIQTAFSKATVYSEKCYTY